MSLGDMLTRQILAGEITVEQAQWALLSYYRRKRRPDPQVKTLQQCKVEAIEDALDRNEGNVIKAAWDLDIGRSTVRRILRRKVKSA